MLAKKRRYFKVKDKQGIVRFHTETFKQVCEIYNMPYHHLKQTSAMWKNTGKEYKGITIKQVYK